jgi:glycosyltransferase involved in cell wall biosynthesis
VSGSAYETLDAHREFFGDKDGQDSPRAGALGKPYVVGCIPAYNEDKTISKVVLQTRKYVDKVLVCDDGSTDMTGEIAKELGAVVILHEKNLGKGAALRSLFNAARKMGADVMVTLDGDAQHAPEEIPRLLQPIFRQEADVVVGCRSMPSESAPAHRRLGNRVLNFFTRLSVRSGNGGDRWRARVAFNDTQSGFRAYSKSALAAIDVTEDGLGVDSQIFLDATEKNLRILEVPISTNYPKDVKTSKKNPLHHGVEVIGTLIELITERRPLAFLGIPGLTLFIAGGACFLIVLDVYDRTSKFAIGTAMVGVVSTLLGSVLLFGAVILWVLGNRLRRIENRLSNHRLES